MYEEQPLPLIWQDWTITERIGKGSFGTVYRAEKPVSVAQISSASMSFCRNEEPGNAAMEYCAIKIIDIPQDEEDLKLIRMECDNDDSVQAYLYDVTQNYTKEIQLMKALQNMENIVRIEDFYIEKKNEIGWRIYIRMEYLQDFRYYCPSHTMSEQETCVLALDICSALSYCEQQKILHRDIKPSNILRSPDGVYKLGDFGMARIDNAASVSYSTKGTFSYMAPEVYYGRHYSNTADIYSLGIVMYRLTNRNRLPFENIYKQMLTWHDKEEALTRRLQGETLPEPVDAGKSLAAIIRKACAYDSKQRYQSAEEMKKDLLMLQQKLEKNLERNEAQGQEGTEERTTVLAKGEREHFSRSQEMDFRKIDYFEAHTKNVSRRRRNFWNLALHYRKQLATVLVVMIVGVVMGNLTEYYHLKQQSSMEMVYYVNIYEEPDIESNVMGTVSEAYADLTGEYTEDKLWLEVYINSEGTGWIQLSDIMSATLSLKAMENLSDPDMDIEKTEILELYNWYQCIIEESIDDFKESPGFTIELSLGNIHELIRNIRMANSIVVGYSTDEQVVTVSSTGKVTAVGTGTAYVMIIVSNGQSAVAKLYKYVVTE